MSDPEKELRTIWTAQGVTKERQDEVLAQIRKAAMPGAQVGPFRIAYLEELTPSGPQLVIPGCERRPADTGRPVQLGLFG